MPDWLVAIIAKLHAKKPADRFASAKEVADLLGRCLLELQQKGRVESVGDILPMTPKPEISDEQPIQDETVASQEKGVHAPAGRPARPRSRRWAAAAAMIGLLVAGLGLTEATGITNVRGTVIRLFSPDGNLVVEVDDPGVSVSIDGEEMVITGTGAKEIRLRPGQYKVLASKDGKVVRQELVTVTRDGRQVVRVSKEAGPVPAVGATDPDRRAAEWVLRDGGQVTVLVGQPEKKLVVKAPKDLPAGPFKLIGINRIPAPRRFAPADLDYLRPLADLRGLVLHLTDLTDADLGRLAQFPAAIHYQGLSLDSPVVTDAGLENLARLPNLESLHLSGTRMTDAGLGSIAAMLRLGDLILHKNSGITDAGLAKLRGLELWNLSLNGNPRITDAGLEPLKELHELRFLYLHKTKVTKAGVEKLAAALPACRIEWDGGVIEPRSPTTPDCLEPGSVWKGTRTYRKGMFSPGTVTYELHVGERDGTKFKGLVFDNGPGRNRAVVEGEIKGETITWRERPDHIPEGEMTMQGTLQRDTIRLTFKGYYGKGRPTNEGDGELKLNVK